MSWLLNIHWSRYIIFAVVIFVIFLIDRSKGDEDNWKDSE